MLTKFQIAGYYTFRDVNQILVWIFATDREMDRRMQSDAYEPTVQVVQVGSTLKQVFILAFYSVIQFRESIRQTIFSP